MNENQEANQATDNTMLKAFVAANYKVVGTSAEKEFRTSFELIHELSEYMTIDAVDLNTVLTELGYATKFIEGVPYWVMYMPIDNENY